MKIIPNKIKNPINNRIGVIFFFSKHKSIFIPLLFIISFVLLYFLVDLSSQSLVAHDEGLYARRSRLIEDSYNWFSSPFAKPHHKTLGSYWLIALSIRLFGNSELSLRLPSILSSFLCLIISYFIAIKVSNKKAALISLFSLSSMPLWLQYSRYASPDLPFVLCTLLVIFFFLNYLDSNKYINKYFYIFLSGLFISFSFFVRSYMAFVPLIGLLPFFAYHLFRSNYIFKTIFISGILIGCTPTFINLYFSYQKHGVNAFTSLFDFARKQAIGSFDFINYFFTPVKFLYFTFPIGLLLIILFTFTRSNNKTNYPLLIYCYPISSLVILLSMSTSYTHYYLFLLPSLSILFAVKLQSFSFRSLHSKRNIKALLLVLTAFIFCVILLIVLNYNDLLMQYSYRKIFIIYIVSCLLFLSYLSSARYLFDSKYNSFDLMKFFNNLIIPQYISFSLLYNFGILGNPNFITKSFINDKVVSSIINSNTIYLYNVDSKINTLLSYYLPSSKVLKSVKDVSISEYFITSDINIINTLENKSFFKVIKKFDNNFLIMNISK